MEPSEHVAYLAAEGALLGDVAATSDLDAPVPGLDWVVRDVVAHVGTVHRWATAIVGTPRSDPRVAPAVIPPDDELIGWYRAGHATLVETLSAAPPDLECWFLFPRTAALAGWARRQALETAMHRIDGQSASGSITPIDAALAADGINELLLGFGGRKREFTPGTITFAPSDAAAWYVTLGPSGLSATQSDPGTPSDLTVTGPVCDVYRWMWNRPCDVEVTGDASVAAQWQTIQVRWT